MSSVERDGEELRTPEPGEAEDANHGSEQEMETQEEAVDEVKEEEMPPEVEEITPPTEPGTQPPAKPAIEKLQKPEPDQAQPVVRKTQKSEGHKTKVTGGKKIPPKKFPKSKLDPRSLDAVKERVTTKPYQIKKTKSGYNTAIMESLRKLVEQARDASDKASTALEENNP